MRDESVMRSFKNTEPLGNRNAPLGNYNVSFGDLVTAVFDCAAQFSADPKEVSRSAVRTVAYMLRHTQRTSVIISPPKPLAKTKPLLRVVYKEMRK
jgi:hypothetical protein